MPLFFVFFIDKIIIYHKNANKGKNKEEINMTNMDKMIETLKRINSADNVMEAMDAEIVDLHKKIIEVINLEKEYATAGHSEMVNDVRKQRKEYEWRLEFLELVKAL